MKTLVTGGTGFLGSYIVEALLQQGHEVRALVRRTSDTSHLKSTAAELVCGDVEDYDTLPPAVEGTEIVFHAASKVTPGWGKWEDFENATNKGTENILKASAQAGVSRFLYTSSGSVYGSRRNNDIPPDECTPCEVACTPDTYYNYAKLKAEEAVLEYQKQGKLNVSVIRPLTIYGPRDGFTSDRIYKHMARQIIVWPGKANPKCAPVYASDVAECAILAATSDQAIGQAYNVAPPEEVRIREFCEYTIRAQGGSRLHVNIPFHLALFFAAIMEGWAKLRQQQEMPYLTRSSLRFFNEGGFVDGSKARRELGWEPKVSMEEGTKRYVEWRRSQQKS